MAPLPDDWKILEDGEATFEKMKKPAKCAAAMPAKKKTMAAR